MAIHLYRRHRVSCSHRSQTYTRCQCPIYAKGTLDGQKVRQSMDQTHWDAAMKIIGQWTEDGHLGSLTDRDTIRVLTAEVVVVFLADTATRNLKPATVAKYRVLLKKKLLGFTGGHNLDRLDALTPTALTKFRATWVEGPLARRKTQERLKAFFKWCVGQQYLTTNPAAGLSPIRVTDVPTLPFSLEEMDRITSAIDRYPTHNSYGRDNRARIRALVLILRWSGLRMSDAVSLQWDRITDGKLQLYTQKTGTHVYVPLPPVVIAALAALPKDGPRLFWNSDGTLDSATSTWRRSLRVLFKLAEVPTGHAHRFRDTFAVELLLAGVDLTDVSILLGHASVKVTEKHYAAWVSRRQARLESAVQRTWAPAPVDTSDVPGHAPSPPPTPESASPVPS